MYPNQQYPPTPQPPQGPLPPLDYLNQIAPQAPKKGMLNSTPKKILFFLGLALIVVIALVVIVNMITGAQRGPAEQLAARLTNTATIAEAAQSNLKSSQLRSTNSNLRVYFTNINRDISTQLAKTGINTEKISGSVAEKETAASTAITDRLEDARLNAQYDRTYAREMSYQLEMTLALIQQLYSSTNSTSLQEFLKNAYDNLLPIQKGFAEFNQTNG